MKPTDLPEEEIRQLQASSQELKVFVSGLAQKTAESLFKRTVSSISHSPVGNMEEDMKNKIPSYAITDVQNTVWKIYNDFMIMFMTEFATAMHAMEMHNMLMTHGIDTTKMDAAEAMDLFRKIIDD